MTEESLKPQIYFSYTDELGYTVSANMDIESSENRKSIEELVYSFSRFLLLAGFDQSTITQFLGPVE